MKPGEFIKDNLDLGFKKVLKCVGIEPSNSLVINIRNFFFKVALMALINTVI